MSWIWFVSAEHLRDLHARQNGERVFPLECLDICYKNHTMIMHGLLCCCSFDNLHS